MLLKLIVMFFFMICSLLFLSEGLMCLSVTVYKQLYLQNIHTSQGLLYKRCLPLKRVVFKAWLF